MFDFTQLSVDTVFTIIAALAYSKGLKKQGLMGTLFLHKLI